MNSVARIIVDLTFGDAGKGTMTDFFCREYDLNLVVRFNGGSQAAHNVVTDDGRHHVFSQFGSGSFVPGVRTLISRYMFWDPIALAHESKELSHVLGRNALDFHVIDERAPIITPFHVAANRIHEWMRGDGRHGSCGKGHGEAVSDSLASPNLIIHAGDLTSPVRTIPRLQIIHSRKRRQLVEAYGSRLDGELPDSIREMWTLLNNVHERERLACAYQLMAQSYFHVIPAAIAEEMIRCSGVVFEGAQGVLIDEWHGFHPFTTWSTTTSKNAIKLLRESGFTGSVETTGVIRTYATRHGAGPFVTEGLGALTPTPAEHNGRNEWQGAFRTGCFDPVMLRYAVDCVQARASLTAIALTHLDLFERDGRVPYSGDYGLPSGSRISSVTADFSDDIRRQESVQKMLSTASAEVVGHFSSPLEMQQFICDETGVPVRYTSSGPCTGDKKVIA